MARRYSNRLIIAIVSACFMGASVSAAATPNDTPLSSAATMGSLEQDSQAFTRSSLGIENSDPDQIPVVDLAQLDSAQLSEFEYKEITFYDPESDRAVIVVTQDHAAGLSTASPQADSESDISSQTLIIDASAVIDSGDYAAGKYAELRVSRYTQSDLDTSMDLLGEFLLSKGLAGAIEYDPWTDTIVLSVPVGANLQLPVTQVPARVEEVANVGASVYNDSMPLPVRGGGAIYAGILRCTSGIPAYNAAGTRGFFTAGHCFKASNSVYTNSNARTFAGKVSHTFGYPTVDAHFISGSRYSNQIYSSTGLQGAKSVIGSYEPTASMAHRVCFTGSTTGTKCDNYVTGYRGKYCDGVCFSNLMTIKGGTSVFANFGSKVKVSGLISGHVNPLIGNSTTFVQQWSAIEKTYAARLMM